MSQLPFRGTVAARPHRVPKRFVNARRFALRLNWKQFVERLHKPAEWCIGHPTAVSVFSPVSDRCSSCALKNIGQSDKERLVIIGAWGTSIPGESLFQSCDQLDHPSHTGQKFLCALKETGCPFNSAILRPIEEVIFPNRCTFAIEV